jgi:hypothetical protein
MKDILDSNVILGLSARHLLLMLGGVMLIASVFMSWVSYIEYGQSVVLSGLELHRNYQIPWIPLLALIGIGFVAGAFVLSRFTEFCAYSRIPKVIGILLAVLSILVLAIVTFSSEVAMYAVYRISFLSNACIGYYTAIVATGILIFSACVPGRRNNTS